MGETVRVRDGYARNFLLARKKALRATEANKKHFETQRRRSRPTTDLKKRSRSRRRDAQRPGLRRDPASRRERSSLRLGRAADIADAAIRRRLHAEPRPDRAESSDQGAGPAQRPVHLHPEVDVKITINVARSAEEAERQARGESTIASRRRRRWTTRPRSGRRLGGSRRRRDVKRFARFGRARRLAARLAPVRDVWRLGPSGRELSDP